ncbi:hypothetical protein DFQ27_007648 [Actinomortierella ambigua]|uniref:Uncharacterized protein n=1 Tax=Actinomortierella ambigua TaxID=1343610 RepID=A0A9P6TZE2_9FUNG|nr:hypothetical protein DFQ27_007648 [Actinomortierella ambigua]
MEYQEFRFNNEILRFPVHTDVPTGLKFSRLDDIQDIFPDVHRVVSDGVIVPYMVDAHQKKYEPKRIPYHPTKVLQLLAPAPNASVQDHPATLPPEYTPDDHRPPAYRDADMPPSPPTPTTTPRPPSASRLRSPTSIQQGRGRARGAGREEDYDILTNSFEFYQNSLPRLFVLLPPLTPSTPPQHDPDGHPVPDFRLYFLCEHSTKSCETTIAHGGALTNVPDNVHLTDHPGYEIKDWDRFLDSYGMHVLRTLLRLTHRLEATRLPLAAATVPYRIDSPCVQDQEEPGPCPAGFISEKALPAESVMLTPERIEHSIAFLEQHVSSRANDEGGILGRGRAGGASQGHGPGPMTASAMSAQTLNQLPNVLHLGWDAPNPNRGALLGGLYRFATKHGQIQWICEEHAHLSCRWFKSQGQGGRDPALNLELAMTPYTQSNLDPHFRKLTIVVQNPEMLVSVLKTALEHDACLSEIEVMCEYLWTKADLKPIQHVLRSSRSIQSVILHGRRRNGVEGTRLRNFFSSSSSSSSSSNAGTTRLFFGTTNASSRDRQPNLLSARIVGPSTGILETDLRELASKCDHLRVLDLTGSMAVQAQPHLFGILQKCTHLTEFSLGQPDPPGAKVTDDSITTTASSALFWRVIRSLHRLETLSLYLIHVGSNPDCLSAYAAVWSTLPRLRHLTLVLYNSLEAMVALGQVNLSRPETLSIQHVAAWRRGFMYEPIVLSTVEAYMMISSSNSRSSHRAIEYDLPKGVSRREMERMVPLLGQQSWTHFGCNLPMDDKWKENEALIGHVEALDDMRRLCSVRLTRFPKEAHDLFWTKYFHPLSPRPPSPSISTKGGDGGGGGTAAFASPSSLMRTTRPLRYLLLSETSIPRTLLNHLHRLKLRRLALYYCTKDDENEATDPSSSSPWIVTLLRQLALHRLERLMITGAQLGEAGVQAWIDRRNDFGRDLMIYLYDMTLTDEQVDRMQGTWLEDALQSLMPSHISGQQKRFSSFSTLNHKVLQGSSNNSSSDPDPAPCWVRNGKRYDREEFVMFYGNNFFP